MHINRDVWTYAIEREAVRRRRTYVSRTRRTPGQTATFPFFPAIPRP
jgi:hypothetical protein